MLLNSHSFADKDKAAESGPPDSKPDKADASWRRAPANAGRKTRAAPQGPRPTSLTAPFEEPAAQTARRQWADYLKQPGEITNTLGMKLLLIPPGEFQMGALETTRTAKAHERPQHTRENHASLLSWHL